MKHSAWPKARREVAQVSERNQAPRLIELSSAAIRSGSVIARVSAPAASIQKEQAVRSEEYRRLVAALPCRRCGIGGYSQAAHPNTGKGGGLKTDDRLCFPLCCDRPGVQGCHTKFDQHALYTKAVRRVIETAWGADTRRQIAVMGQWPANLKRFEDDEK